MAFCVSCHTLEKQFFAPRCSECNVETGFLMQCLGSIVYTTAYVGGIILFGYFILSLN